MSDIGPISPAAPADLMAALRQANEIIKEKNARIEALEARNKKLTEALETSETAIVRLVADAHRMIGSG
jgi:uncharacterized protein YlxW (UPF0749 family)